MDPKRLFGLLESQGRERARRLLRAELKSLNSDEVVEFVRLVAIACQKNPESAWLAEELRESLSIDTLPVRCKVNISEAILPILWGTPCACRSTMYEIFLDLNSGDINRTLEVTFTMAASSHTLESSDKDLLVYRLMLNHGHDADVLVKTIQRYKAAHEGNPNAAAFDRELREALGLQAMERIQGPIIRNQFFKEIIRAEKTNDHVLLIAPSGCGKTTLAEIIHANGGHKAHPFREYKCDDEFQRHKLHEDLLEDESLKGATILLDEVHCLHPEEDQRRLLHAPNRLQLQVISATSHDYVWLQDERNMLRDFMRRFARTYFTILPLRERPADFHEFARVTVERRSKAIDQKLVGMLLAYHQWGGNNVDLHNFLDRLCGSLPPARRITAKLLARELGNLPAEVRLIVEKLPILPS